MAPAASPSRDPPTDHAQGVGFVEFLALIAPSSDALRSLRELHTWLVSLDPSAPLSGRLERLRAGTRWLRGKGALPASYQGPSDALPQVRRLLLLLDALDRVPALGDRFGSWGAALLTGVQGLGLLEIGLPNPRGFTAEAADRLARRFLPTVRDPSELAAWLLDLFPSARDARWLRAISPDLLRRLTARVDFRPLLRAVDDAIALAAIRISALGLTAEIRSRAADGEPRNSPFFALPRACDAAIATAPEEIEKVRSSCDALLLACRREVTVVVEHLEQFGVSFDVVYRLEAIGANLERLAMLLDVKTARDPGAAAELLASLVAAAVQDRSLRALWRTNTHLLARKVIEHAGRSGEHYITRSRREWWGMMGSAGGGGVLTAGTTAFKYVVAHSQLPLFVEGFLSSTNYALSFLAMQLFGFTLATKQPSMTAAALAAVLKANPSPREPGEPDTSRLEPLVTLIARICRSQLAAAIGNLALVIPAALAFNAWWRHRTGHAFLDPESATHTLHSLHPLRSGTVPFAALTGVLLWASSLGAGWLENWITYRRVPDAIAEHRLGRFVGARPLRWLAHRLQHGISGIGGNVSLGFLLGMLPVIGKFLGVPLEVRHVTLSTGGLTLAAAALGNAVGREELGWAAGGIVVIGALNFGVSFVLALAVALRARAVEHGTVRLAAAVLGRLLRSPFAFVYPPKTEL